MKVKDFLKSKGIDGYNLELSTEEKGWHSGDLKKLLKDYKKQLNLHDVIPSSSRKIECICGWEGKTEKLYYREKNKEFNISASLECPKCYSELIKMPN